MMQISHKTLQHCCNAIKNPQFCDSSVLLRGAFVFSNSFAATPQSHADSTISYLIASCGLSHEAATRVSQKIRLQNPDKSNAVLALLRSYGFTQRQIAQYIEKRPTLLLSKAEKTLSPKLEFLASIGFSPLDLPKMVLKDSTLLARSLKDFLIPRYKALRSVVGSDSEAVKALRRGLKAFVFCDVMKNLVPNIEFLRGFGGATQDSVSSMMMFHPRQAYMKHEKFVEGVIRTMEMGFDPKRVSFVNALQVLLHLDEAKLESRIKGLEKWGWSREFSLLAFRKYPTLMSYSEERIDRAMSFLVEDMGWSAEDIAKFPAALAYHLEKRIIPRCRVIKVLKSKGLVKDHLGFRCFLCAREEVFLESFVIRFREDAPLLLKVYQGSIDYRDAL